MQFTITNLMLLTWVVINGCLGARVPFSRYEDWLTQYLLLCLVINMPLTVVLSHVACREHFLYARWPWSRMLDILLALAASLAHAAGHVLYASYE